MIIDSVNSLLAPNSSARASTTLSATGERMTSAISAFDNASRMLDLTTTPRPISQTLDGLHAGTSQDSLALLAKLLQQGVVGTVSYDVYGQPYTRFLETTIGDHRLYDLKQYRDRSVTATRLDRRA